MNSFNHGIDLSNLDPGLIDIVDEITEMFAAGEEPQLDDLCSKYPHVAEPLRRLFPAIAMLATAGFSNSDAHFETSLSESTTPRTLGDFKILRELGRGGMGIVYEAEQVSLGRRVALKILPLAAMLDAQQLARFKNESRAAAALRHPNIVGVHAVGVERGVHYYAMELIEGQSLASVIADIRSESDLQHRRLPAISESRSSECAGEVDTKVAAQNAISTRLSHSGTGFHRTVAEIGIQAAEALEYAHDQGVVHRDIKPANLMINERGQVFITDFGLARIETDAGLTVSGDLLGTIRYMSPEQASGDAILDHRTDIYSLGLVLYELLTQCHAFNDTDRHQLLSKIADADPIAPCRINAAIPKDLETIVLKAIAKLPESRYVTAQAMSDDLQRFLDNRPVIARRAGRLENAWRWIRRAHRNPLTASLSLILLFLLLGLALVGPVCSIKYAQLAARESEARKSAELATARAARNCQRLQAVLDNVLMKVATEIASRPGLETFSHDLYEQAFSYYTDILGERGNDHDIRLALAISCRELGGYDADFRSGSQTAELYATALAALESLANDFPENMHIKMELAETLRRQGHLSKDSNPVDSLKLLTRSVALGSEVLKTSRIPQDQCRVSACRSQLAALTWKRESSIALKTYTNLHSTTVKRH